MSTSSGAANATKRFHDYRRNRNWRRGMLAALGAVVLAVVIGFVAYSLNLRPPIQVAREHLRAADDRFGQGDLRRAASHLRDALQRDPNNAEARVRLGRLEADLGNLEAAERELERARALGAPPEQWLEPLAGVWLSRRRYDKVVAEILAEESFDDALFAEAVAARGTAWAARGAAPVAVDAFTLALERDPWNRRATAGIVRLLSDAGGSDDGRRELETRVAEHPDDLPAKRALAALAVAERRWAEAVAGYRAVVAAAPNDRGTLNALAHALWRDGRADEAVQLAERAMAAPPESAPVLHTGGLVLIGAGRIDEGVALLRRAHARAENDPTIRFHLASGLADLGEAAAARTVLQPALSGNAAFPERTEAAALLRRLAP